MIYAVIDTNVLVSAALAFGRAFSVPYSVFKAVVERKFVPLVDDNIVREYCDVLSRSKFSLKQDVVDGIVQTIVHAAINQPVPPSGIELPDSDDVVFYDVARAHQDKGAYLVTGNLKHFPNCGFAVSPRDFMNIITPNKGNHMVNDNSAVYDPTGLLAALHEAQRQAHENGVDNLTEEEIEAEIKAARAERKKRLGTNG
ncbi:putative toxin-antitoxin system toxin component, PIN family [Fibrobacter sp.]|uniref:PIN domain-containing protein n=1 Tax=Fibrobacter sp. TaxID=35828 RepID=UPI0025C01A27|nr:PIN domain-containing protein [Fibrobacter sp.]MBS7272083.1 PIN domain-containing protein [Fibrobacter sp.]MCI6437875.1 PIN domain-containing protein [Fibrobacter sp.]MDD7497784.1 PIN domain-containing protein [Fibrobacter sp.]MDY5723306.1 PIN domain-containing protein [Fibrobacter sp.]